jgi:hypothetical protein
VIDLGATHGTYVNGRRLDKHKPEKLTDGAELLVGQAPFAYRISRADGGEKRKPDAPPAAVVDTKRVRTLPVERELRIATLARVWHGAERWTNPKLSRRTCTCEYGLESCRIGGRARQRSPSLRFATFASL